MRYLFCVACQTWLPCPAPPPFPFFFLFLFITLALHSGYSQSGVCVIFSLYKTLGECHFIKTIKLWSKRLNRIYICVCVLCVLMCVVCVWCVFVCMCVCVCTKMYLCKTAEKYPLNIASVLFLLSCIFFLFTRTNNNNMQRVI